MPAERVRHWLEDRRQWLRQHPQPHSHAEQAKYDRLFSQRWENWLDESHGQCDLAKPRVRKIVQDALKHFDGQRYVLGEFVVMPNHVHVLVAPLGAHELSGIVQSWKSFTAHRITRLLNQKGEFWQKETFDHIVRNAEEMERFAQYIRENPVRIRPT